MPKKASTKCPPLSKLKRFPREACAPLMPGGSPHPRHARWSHIYFNEMTQITTALALPLPPPINSSLFASNEHIVTASKSKFHTT